MLIPELFLLFAFFVNLGLGVLVFFKSQAHKRINLIFSALGWACAGWGFSLLMIYLGVPTTLFWGRMSFATSGVTPFAFLLFSLVFPRKQVDIKSFKIILLSLPPLLFFGLSFTDQIVSSPGTGKQMFNYGPFYHFFSIYLICSYLSEL